jgi:hypothetical protein
MSLNIVHETAIYCNSPIHNVTRRRINLGQSSKDQHLEKERELSDRPGSSGYPSLGDTGAAVLQGRDNCVLLPQNCCVTCRHIGRASYVQCAATFVYFQEIKIFTGTQTFFNNIANY